MPNLFRLALTLALCWLAATASAAVSGTITSVSYASVSSTGPFPVTFAFLNASDLRVQETSSGGAITTLNYPTDYSVSGGAAPNSTTPLTGSVTLNVAPTSVTLVIDRGNMPATQPVVLPNAGPVQATAVSGGLDRGTLLVQQVGSVAARSIQFPVGDTASPVLPVASARAGGFVSFDGSGNATVTQTQPGTPPASWVSVKSFGAYGDGVHDDTTAIQSAINAVSLTGGVVYIPAGTFNVSASLTVDSNDVVVQGAGGWLYHDSTATTPVSGTKIQWVGPNVWPATNEVMHFLTVENGGERMTGLGLHDVWIDGGAAASYGLFCQSFQRGSFSNIHVSNVTTAAFLLSALTVNQTEKQDLQSCVFTQCTWRMIDTTPVQSATGVVISTPSPTTDTNNVSYNEFHLCSGQTYNAPGIQITNGDNNFFQGCRCFVEGANIPGLLLQGASTACDYNVFSNCQFSASGSGSGSGFIQIQGTNSGFTWSPRANTFFCMDDSNATVFPTMDASCDCQFHTSGGGWQRQRMYTGVATVGGLTVSTYLRVITGAAAPTTKTWAVGDRCINATPAVGQPKGWVCTVAGTPGTWVSEGNL